MRIYLRALEIEDHKITTKWRNDAAITELLGGNTYFISHEREKKWVENVIANDLTNIRLGICLIENNHFIG